jgi:hypothetical protein
LAQPIGDRIAGTLVEGLAEWYASAASDIEVLNVSVQDSLGDPADATDAQAWADWHGAGWIDVADPDESWIAVWKNINSDYYISQSYTVIGADGLVAWRGDGVTSSTLVEITNAVEAAP